MGVAHVGPTTALAAQKDRRMLFIHPPEQYRNFLLNEDALVGDNYSVARFAAMRSVDVALISWSGRKLKAEQWLQVLGNHTVITYFFHPEEDHEEKLTQSQVESEMRNAIQEALDSSPRATVLIIIPKTLSEASAVARRKRSEREAREEAAKDDPDYYRENPSQLDADGFEIEEDDTPEVDYVEVAKHSGFKHHVFDHTNEQAMFDLRAYMASFIVPMDLFRALSEYVYDLADCCDATEVHLLDGATCLPMLSADDVHVNKYLQSKLSTLTNKLKRQIAVMTDLRSGAGTKDEAEYGESSPIKAGTSGVEFLSLCINNVDIHFGYIYKPYVMVLIVREKEKAKEKGLRIGEGLVQKNCERVGLQIATALRTYAQSPSFASPKLRKK